MIQARPNDPAEVVLERRIEGLVAEVAKLKEQVARYEELFVRHHYNADRSGISPEQLARPLPETDKGQTDGRRLRQVR